MLSALPEVNATLPVPAVPAAADPRGRTPLAARILTLLLGVTAAAPFPNSGPIVFALALTALTYAVLSGPLTRPHGTILAFLGWCAVTVGWSVTPAQTVRGVLITAAAALATCSLVARLPLALVYRSLATALKILIVLSWALFLGVPGMGREQDAYHHGSLTGVFIQRNSAAFVLAVAVLTFMFTAISPDFRHRMRSFAWAVVAMVSLVATESGTGLAVTVVCATMMVVALWVRRWSRLGKRSLAVLLGIAAGAVALNAQSVLAVITGLLGRDDTLTGRTVIWAAIGPYVRARPWQGYGWAALWTPDSLVTRAMWAVAGFDFPHAHDAYLDTLAQCGIVGLVLLMSVFLVVLVRSGRAMLSGRDGAWPAWPLVVTVFLLIYGIPEQAFMSHFGWLVLISAYLLVRPGGRLPQAQAEAPDVGQTAVRQRQGAGPG